MACAGSARMSDSSPQISRPSAPVRLLQANRAAHVLLDVAARSVGYVIFDPSAPLVAGGPLKSVTQPCLVLMQADGARTRIGLAVPDPERIGALTLNLSGSWRAEAAESRVKTRAAGLATMVEVTPDGIMPLAFTLQREASSPASLKPET